MRGHIDSSGRLSLYGGDAARQELKDTFRPGVDGVDVVVEISRVNKREKTNPSLGYLWGHLAWIALTYLRKSGWTVLTKESAIEKFKVHLGFTETITGPNNEEIVIPKSIANASSVELFEFAEALYFFLLDAGEDVIHPENYKK
jgi:hypothetical protein